MRSVRGRPDVRSGMKMFESLKTDLNAVMMRDPAARSKWEVFWGYGGFKAIRKYRKANWFYRHGMYFIARMISNHARKVTGVEIHPAAKIGKGVFIDHGTGVVIGETAEVGDNVIIYQGVTLGGTGKDKGKRHPTIEHDVMISAGAKVLGPITIGAYSKIGAGSVVLKNVPEHCTVVGVPGRIVKQAGERVNEMDQIKLPDPVLEEFARLNRRIAVLEEKLKVNTCKYSITTNDLENYKENKNEPENL